jgi:hypothetical protein
MSKEKKYRFILQLNIDEWGSYKKGEIETFWMDLLPEANGLVRWPIDKHWNILRCDDYVGIDKNGDYIYENDKVSFKLKNSTNQKLCTGIVQWDDVDACFFIHNNDDKHPFISFSSAHEIEIIEE